jgi:hypothetical protein
MLPLLTTENNRDSMQKGFSLIDKNRKHRPWIKMISTPTRILSAALTILEHAREHLLDSVVMKVIRQTAEKE